MQDWDSTTGKAKFVFMCKLYTESVVNSDDPKMIYLLFIQVRPPRSRAAAMAVVVVAAHVSVMYT